MGMEDAKQYEEEHDKYYMLLPLNLSDIVAVDADDNILFRSVNSANDSECVLSVKRQKYFDLINKLLDDKKWYYKHYGYYCGAATPFVHKVKDSGRTSHYWKEFDKGGNTVYKDIPVLIAEDIGLDVENYLE